jgi:hypothetical protein
MFKLMGRRLTEGKWIDSEVISNLTEEEATSMRPLLDGQHGYVAVWVEYDENAKVKVQVHYKRSDKFKVSEMSTVRYLAAVAQAEINSEEIEIAVV